MGSGQSEILADELNQQRPVIALAGNGTSVHGHCYIGHQIPPLTVLRSRIPKASFSFFSKGSTINPGYLNRRLFRFSPRGKTAPLSRTVPTLRHW
jgi:hypothetical protein